MYAALVTLDLHVPASGSLKAKRAVVRSLMAALRNDLHASVAEVGHQDLWQRCELGVALACSTYAGALKVAQQVEKIVFREPRVELIGAHVQVVTPES